MYIILYHDIINMKYNKYENNKKKNSIYNKNINIF